MGTMMDFTAENLSRNVTIEIYILFLYLGAIIIQNFLEKLLAFSVHYYELYI